MDVLLRLVDEVSWQGRAVPGDRPGRLLRALVEAWPSAVPAGELVGAVWGAATPDHPAKALQVLVSRTRTATSPRVIERTATGYRLGLDPAEVDVLARERFVSAAENALAAGDPARAAAAATSALELGPHDRAERIALLTDPGRPAGELERFVRAHPHDEQLAAAWLRRVGAEAGPGEALLRYEEVRGRLARDLGTDPGAALRSVHRELLAADEPVRSGVRHAATSLLGREADLEHLRMLLERARLVSIVGTGGLGKTRLAQEIARETSVPAVYVVELASVAADAEVPAALARAVDVREAVTSRDRRPAQLPARLAERLARVPTLLVLDNCEHVVEAVADLAAFLLSQVPDLRILTTSRTPLHLTAEHVYPLDHLSGADAADLFRERARAVRPEAVLEHTDVRRLVTHLDGLPLAIELAAARVRTMSLPEILTHLSDRFALLTDGERGAPARHRTLEAVIDWSWHLLDPPGREALALLTAWPDGFTADAATAMLGSGAPAALANLLDQSLLTVAERRGALRYRMLETVREYGRRELQRAGRAAEADRAVQDWAAVFARRHGSELFGARQLDAVARLRPEETTLADTLRVSLDTGEVEIVVPVLAALVPYWFIRGEHVRIMDTFAAIEDFLAAATLPAPLAQELRPALAVLTLAWAILPRSHPFEHGLRLLAEVGPGPEPFVAALVRIGSRLSDLPNRADPQAPARLRDLAEDPERFVALLAAPFLSMLLENAGEIVEAIEVLEHAMGRSRAGDPPWLDVTHRAILAQLHSQLGQSEAARAQAERALPVFERLGALDDIVQSRAIIAASDLARGDLREAQRGLAEAADLQRHGRGLGARTAVMLGLAEIAYAGGDRDRARTLLDQCTQAGHAMQRAEFAGADGLDPWSLVTIGAALALRARHDPQRAGDGWDDLLDRALRASDPGRGEYDFPVLGTVCFGLAAAGLQAGRIAREHAALLLVLAGALGYNRFLPSLAWDGPRRELEPAQLTAATAVVADRRGHDLIPLLHEHLGIIRRADSS